MKFTLQREEKYNIIKVDEEKLDSTISPDLKSEFLTMQGQGIGNLIVDLSEVKYIDSSGLGALLVGNRVFTEGGGSFVMSGVSDHAKKLISISQLDKVLTVLPTVEESIDLVFMNELEQGLKEEGDAE
ncbi:STAS domain-containing protein [Reichenbachiella versicolor]|uniref:STAS domain-containing protein n=1 Tax=Reichenbachiella versicolor TaxID=1821036 RepID=UPI000D6DE75C|nr:STAS domain-containing protein [Reichenbachiella versicolor]